MDKTRDAQNKPKTRYQLAGWLLFVLCALFFIASSVHNGDTLTFIGSVIFLVACVVFIVPVIRESKAAGDRGNHFDDARSADKQAVETRSSIAGSKDPRRAGEKQPRKVS